MPQELDVIGVALRIAAAVELAGGEYFIGGSVASALQGDPRATNDIDIVLSLPLGAIGEFRRALGDDFEVDVEILRTALLRASTANAFFLPLVTKIDFFGRGYGPYDASEFSRRRQLQVRATGETLVVKAPEDTILRKLLWYRAGGHVSEKQWRDVLGVFRVCHTVLDYDYLTQWAARLHISELLKRAMGEPT